jgi:hypothetical protein
MRQIAAQGMRIVAPSPTFSAGCRQSLSGRRIQEVLRSWMEDPDATDLRGRVTAALATVDALLGVPAGNGN